MVTNLLIYKSIIRIFILTDGAAETIQYNNEIRKIVHTKRFKKEKTKNKTK